MVSGVFNISSVISFVACDGWQFRVRGRYPTERGTVWPVVGWAVVVTARNAWVTDTVMRPVVVDSDGVLRVATSDEGTLERWR